MKPCFIAAEMHSGRERMATYDYRCDRCDVVKEEKHGMMEDPEIICPICLGFMRKYLTSAGCNIQKYGDAENMSDWEENKNRPR